MLCTGLSNAGASEFRSDDISVVLGDVFGEVQQYTVLDRNTDLRQPFAHILCCMFLLLNPLAYCSLVLSLDIWLKKRA
jgi:hypothetical protein